MKTITFSNCPIILTKFSSHVSSLERKPRSRIRPQNPFIPKASKQSILMHQNKQSILMHQNKKQHSFHEQIIFKPLHNFITNIFLNGLTDLSPSIDPKHVLSGNFYPVDELHPTPCELVVGSLPPSLDGAYIQNAPNPQFTPRGPYHIADGDGMLHSIKISNGGAVFCSRYVKTYKYAIERDLGYSVIPNLIAVFTDKSCFKVPVLASIGLYLARTMIGQFYPSENGIGTANTSLVLFGGSLFAIAESDLPYEVKIMPDGDVVTVGRHDFDGGKSFMNITAHPKIDRDTGELFAFRYFGTKPYVTYFRVDSNGAKQEDVPILSMEVPSMVHDFAVTEHFAVFPNTQIVCDPLNVMRGRPIVGFDPESIPKLGVVPRCAEDESEMRWMEVPGLNMVHVVNAWEEDGGGTIVIMAVNALSFEHFLERMELIHSSLERITIDTKGMKVVDRRPVSPRSLEFGVINPRFTGKKNRYIYTAEIEIDTMSKIAGVAKIDMSLISDDCVAASRLHGPGCYGSQPIFVAREPDNLESDEDDGHLLSYVHNENTHESHFVVMDAKSPSLEIVAVVKLPRRVPYGFHSIFVPEGDLPKL